MPTLAELKQQAEPARRRIEGLEKTRIAVCIDTSSIAKGAIETLQALRDEVARRNMDVIVDQVGGNGLSFANPVVIVQTPVGSKVLYREVHAHDVPRFVESVLVKGEDYDQWTLGALHGRPGAHVPMMEDHPWWSIQTRHLMADMGEIDPENIDEAIARGAYEGLERAMGMSQEAVIAEVIASTLGGRGGSYFPTGRKWDFLRTSTTHPKNMVCNADEGDPGAWLNRMTMECDPHSLIEGMMIGGWATGAYHGYIYIREEYPLAFERLQKAVDQAYEKGILGKNVLGRDWSFDMHVVRGAGSYVCGEESGLIASIEDGRGMPKIRPPFPAASGVFGEGSNVNNVESYHTATWVMRHGVDEWKKTGTERNAGSKMFCVSGNVNRVGCFELPFGTPLRQLLEACGGGVPEARPVKAIQVGGPLTGLTPDFYLDLGMEAEVYRENKLGSLGGGGFVFVDDGGCVINLLSQLHWFIEDESCGRCTTCHGGTQRMVEILRRIQRGGGRDSDVGKLRLICDTLRNANCQHGQLAPVTILHTLDWFMEDLEEHIYDRRCRAGVCKGLIEYQITAQEGDLQKAAGYCPTNAIVQEEGVWLIDQDLCIRCNACKEIAPAAVTIMDRFPPGIGPAPELISVQPAQR
jgi:NADH:ubiquinone oxidoreductase subunit F (NADH-binding)/(2Fe-2S) ferredoxin/ferredoxin